MWCEKCWTLPNFLTSTSSQPLAGSHSPAGPCKAHHGDTLNVSSTHQHGGFLQRYFSISTPIQGALNPLPWPQDKFHTPCCCQPIFPQLHMGIDSSSGNVSRTPSLPPSLPPMTTNAFFEVHTKSFQVQTLILDATRKSSYLGCEGLKEITRLVPSYYLKEQQWYTIKALQSPCLHVSYVYNFWQLFVGRATN